MMKRKFSRKGFTLIELLAVIIILAILMTLAITAMSGYIRNARKDTFITTAQQYANAARLSFVNGEYSATVGRGQCIAIKTSGIALESGSTDSSFGNAFDSDASYILIYNAATAAGDEDRYYYYMQMADDAGNGFGLIGENDVERDDVVEKDVTSATNYQSLSGKSAGGTGNAGTLNLPNPTGSGSVTCNIVAIES